MKKEYDFSTMKSRKNPYASKLKRQRNPSSMPENEVRRERLLENSDFTYPSLWRRGLIIFFYALFAYIALILLATTLVSDACFNNDKCSSRENVYFLLFGWAILIVVGMLMILGVKGQLWGARRRIQNPTDLP